jgi:hypothetical protein
VGERRHVAVQLHVLASLPDWSTLLPSKRRGLDFGYMFDVRFL